MIKGFFIAVIAALFFSLGAVGFAQEQDAPSSQDTMIAQALPAAGPLPAPKPAAAPKGRAQPEQSSKISLDIKGMDIVDVIKMIATRAGMNVVVGKNVSGRVTLFLKDVDVYDAFEIILAANDLAFEKVNGIVNVMSQRDYELAYGRLYQDKKSARIIQLKYAKAASLARSLNQIKTNLGKVVVDEASNTVALVDTPEKLKEMEEFIRKTDLSVESRVFTLNYSTAEKLSAKLQEMVTKEAGSMRIDERTNKIFIIDYPYKLDEIAKVVAAFDERTPQVLIDAQVIEVKPTDLFEMGMDWEYLVNKYFDIKASLPIGTANRLIATVPATGEKPSEYGGYKAVIDILRTIGDTKVLSSPRIMALNNEEARIHVGVRDAYITSTVSQSTGAPNVTAQTVNFVDTGIQLRVTPTISRDGFVTMKIKPEISDSDMALLESGGEKTSVPIVTTSEAETTVTVRDGVTIIIGGLRKDKREKTVKKIPILGDIPGLGFLFRSTKDDVTQSDLVILLTPHIMSGEHTFTDFAEVPPRDGARARFVDGKILTDKFSSSDRAKDPAVLVKEVSAEDYRKIIADKVDLNVVFAPSNKKGEVKVKFKVSSSGNLIGEPEVVKAVDQDLVPLTLKAIKNASPFPPFPKGLDKPEEVFFITIVYD